MLAAIAIRAELYRNTYFHFSLMLVLHNLTNQIMLAAIAMIAGILISAEIQHSKVRNGDVLYHNVGSHTTVSRWKMHFCRLCVSERGSTTCRIWSASDAGK
jgi:hypothetical protein